MIFWMLLLKAVGAWSHQLAGDPMQRGREGGRRLKGPLSCPGSEAQPHTMARSLTTPVQCPEDYFNPNKKGDFF